MTSSNLEFIETEVMFNVTTRFGAMHVILKTIIWTRTLKGGGFGLTERE